MKETCSFCRSFSLSKESESINEIKKNHEMVGDYDGNDGGDLFCTAVGKSGGKMVKTGSVMKLGQARATKYVNAKYIK